MDYPGPGSLAELLALARAAFEAAEHFFVPADLGGHRFETVTELIDLDGKARERVRLASSRAAVLDESSKIGASIKRRAAPASTSRHLFEGD